MRRPVASISDIARQDLDKHILWLWREAGPDIATRFANAAIASFARLAEMPGQGSPIESRDAGISEIRKWRIAGFPQVLFFYRAVPAGIDILRVIHGSQDWWSLLNVE